MERTLDQHLDHLKGELLKMGSAVEESIEQAVQSLVERDNHLADVVEEGGHDIDDWEVAIEEECLKLLAVQQPVAGDLRLVAGIMKINYDLERINDQAVNIAQRARLLNQMPQLKPLIDIPRMAELARGMVRDALDAFVNRDVELANKVRRIDDINGCVARSNFPRVVDVLKHRYVPRLWIREFCSFSCPGIWSA